MLIANQRLCDLCFAEKPSKRGNPHMNYKNMNASAPYALATMDHCTYMHTQVVSEWAVVEGWTLHTCVFDVMHNLFLGTGRDFVPGCLRVLLERGCFDWYGVARDSNEMFANITMEIRQTYRDHKFLC